jgi:hypothetical protein
MRRLVILFIFTAINSFSFYLKPYNYDQLIDPVKNNPQILQIKDSILKNIDKVTEKQIESLLLSLQPKEPQVKNSSEKKEDKSSTKADAQATTTETKPSITNPVSENYSDLLSDNSIALLKDKNITALNPEDRNKYLAFLMVLDYLGNLYYKTSRKDDMPIIIKYNKAVDLFQTFTNNIKKKYNFK